MTNKTQPTKTGTFEQFKAMTLAVARGERTVNPGEPKIWIEARDGDEVTETSVTFTSLEAGAKLLSAKNRELLHLIVTRAPQSVTELATMAERAPQNVQRTLNRLSAAGIVRLNRGEGRAIRPVLAARTLHIEIDLAQEN
jgi:predicted transcriptional regulator